MGLNGRYKEEYDLICNYDFEDSRVFEELNDDEDEDAYIESLRGTIGKGDCVYSGCDGEMIYTGMVVRR